MNARVAGALEREHVARHVLRRRSRTAHILRTVAIVTTVLMLWAASYAFANQWLGPVLVGERPAHLEQWTPGGAS